MASNAGVCRFCGCSDEDACYVDDMFDAYPVCHWIDRTRSVCSACAPAAKAEAIALRTLVKAGYRSKKPGIKTSLDFVQAFHQGFVVGWFGISRRSTYGRNPYFNERAEAWDLGQSSGTEASRGYQRICGPLLNTPRQEVLRSMKSEGRRR